MSAGDLNAVARRAAGGDRDAFAALCRALQDDVWRYCLTLTGDHHLAVEAAQETFLRAVTAIRRFRGDAPVRVWLLVIARRATGAVLRGERRHRDRRADLTGADPTVADRTGVVEVTTAVADLARPYRQAFVLTQVLGLSYEEAAAVAGCAVGTIRSRVYRAREQLIDALAHDEEGNRDVTS